MRFHRFLMIFLYSLTGIVVAWILYHGWDYYSLPLTERPHSDLHTDWKAGGFIGHALGIAGAILMSMLLLYIARKHFRFMQDWGNLRHWLDVHIWMGITGPILVIFHTTFKFGGIVAIAFWSMLAVALSGFLGRYVYLQIPRSLSGAAMSGEQLEQLDDELMGQIRDVHGVDEELIEKLHEDVVPVSKRKTGFAAIFTWIGQDVRLRLALSGLRGELKKRASLGNKEIKDIIDLVRRRTLLKRRMRFLQVSQKILHYWHVIHRPFAIVMFIILAIHIVVAALFGYTWIF
ncbi:hypothetical protein KQI63_16485 [bacterium]|nr:hypothetical protein [bacterium]